jgi:hypothetical protein
MSALKEVDQAPAAESDDMSATDLLLPLLGSVKDSSASGSAGVVVGRLVGIRDEGRTPLIVFAGQCGTAAVAARSTVDVQAAHVGRQVVLIFEQADVNKPIIIGVLRGEEAASPLGESRQVTVDADGERLVVSARHQLVFQCGKASITLTAAGKVLIQGTYVLSKSSGVNRIRGGSVQVN